MKQVPNCRANGDSLNHIVDDIVSRSLFYNAIPYRMNIEK